MKLDLNSILKAFNDLNDQVRYAILVGVIFLIILLDVIFLILPQMTSIANINDQIKKDSDDTAQVSVDKGQLNFLKKNLNKERLQFEAVSGRIRSIQEVPIILTTISSIANEYGVKIDQLTPEKNLQEAVKAAVKDKYYSLPVVIRAHCGYHMFGRFLNKLEREKLFFIVKDFIVQNDDKDVQSRLYSLTINMILVDRAASPSVKL